MDAAPNKGRKTMTYRNARRWLGIYFLLVTVGTGIFLLTCSGSSILPLTAAEAGASFKIIIPVLIAQVTVIFQWIANMTGKEVDTQECPIPPWAIVLPPVCAVFIIVSATLVLALANREDSTLSMSPESFGNAITFSVTLLNASTVFFVAKLFPSAKPTKQP
jgi:hypothetical protein